MEEIKWTEDLSVGIAAFDEQHKTLVRMINRLIREWDAQTLSETVSDLLTEMTKYAQEHFASEEEMMTLHDYPHRTEHIRQHREFRKRTVEFCSKTMLNVPGVTNTMAQYLKDWLLNHILVTDKAYSSFFRIRGIR